MGYCRDEGVIPMKPAPDPDRGTGSQKSKAQFLDPGSSPGMTMGGERGCWEHQVTGDE